MEDKKGKISTVNLERQLLKYLLKDKMFLQRYHGMCQNYWFTTGSRLFIFQRITEYFEEKRTYLTKAQFEYELEKFFNKDEHELKINDFASEFKLISEMTNTDEIELIIDKLNEAELYDKMDNLLTTAYDKLTSGRITEAWNDVKVGSIALSGGSRKGEIISLHGDTDEWVKEIENRKHNPAKYAGIPTGLYEFDKKTGGLFKAELTVIFGLSGKGKSTVMKAISSNIRKAGFNVLHCGNEENKFQMQTKYQALESQIKYFKFKNGKYSDEEFEEWKAFNAVERLKKHIYIYEFPQQSDATYIERAVAELECKGIHIDVICVDYLDLMSPVKQSYSENDEQGKITSDLKQLAVNCDCPVITATQAAQASEKQEIKERPFLTAADVFGTKRKVHSANTLLGIVNKTATVGVYERSDEEKIRHHLVLCVPKNRDGCVFTFRQVMEVETGRLVEEDDIEKADLVLNEIERQTGEMVDDSNVNGVRPAIDLKKIQDEVGATLRARAEELYKDMSDMPSQAEIDAKVKKDLKAIVNVQEEPSPGDDALNKQKALKAEYDEKAKKSVENENKSKNSVILNNASVISKIVANRG